MAQVDLIEVEVEDFVFFEGLVDLVGQQGLFDLALVAALRGQQEALGHLLGDGAAALDDGAGLQVFEEGAHDAEDVDALVFVEAGILCADEGLAQLQRYLLQRDDDAPFAVELGDFAVVVRIDRGDDRGVIVLEGADFGQIPAQIEKDADGGGTSQQH